MTKCVCVCVNVQVHCTDTMSNQNLTALNSCETFQMTCPHKLKSAKLTLSKISLKDAKIQENSLRDTSLSVNSTHSKESEAATLYALTT